MRLLSGGRHGGTKAHRHEVRGKELRMKVLALVTDLIFGSRINGEAKAAGVEVRILRKAEQVLQAEGDILLADLNLPGAAEAAAQWGKTEGRRVVGFVSHMD